MGGITAILCAGTAIYIGYYGVTALMVTINDTSIKKREEKEYPQQIERYNKECRNVDETNESNLKKYNSDLECWNKSRAESMSVIDSHYQNTKRLLFALYKKGVIYEKYQTLPALTSIYEYFLTGRCEELSGAHGAYNVYEDEVRKDTVISQLNAVIENLEQIKQNQYMLYQTVKEIQAEVKREESVWNQWEKRGAASSVIEAQKEAVKAAKKKLEAALNTPTEKAIQVCKDIFKVHKEQAKLLKEEIGDEKYQAFFSTIKQINTILNKREVE